MYNTKKRVRLVLNAPVTITFSSLCFLVFLLTTLTGSGIRNTLFSVYHSSLSDPLTYIRFFGHILGHENWSHLVGNLMYILVLGPLLEEKYSSRNMVSLILITAFVTGVLCYIFTPQVAMYGASGVVFAMIFLSSFTSFRDGTIPLTAILVAILYIGSQLYSIFFEGGNVAYLAHIAGGAVGAVLGYRRNKKG